MRGRAVVTVVIGCLLAVSCTSTTGVAVAPSAGMSGESGRSTVAPTRSSVIPPTPSSTSTTSVGSPPTTPTPTPTPTTESILTSTVATRTTTRIVTPSRPTLPSVGLDGVNDAACVSDHLPVLMLHGTVSNPASNFRVLAATIRASGRCVFAVLYGAVFGLGGVGPVRTSARQVAGFARQVLAVTSADQLDVVGYSQGGLLLRTMLDGDLDPALVHTAVLIAPSFHGTTSRLTTAIPAGACPACADQSAGSALLAALAQDGDLAGQVSYAVISTRRDTVVTPISSQVPKGPADRVTAVVVEDSCPQLRTDHVDLPAEPAVGRWVVAALNSDGHPSPADLGC